MNEEERIQKMNKIHDEASQKLDELGKKKKAIVEDYLKELEEKRIKEIQENLGESKNS